MQAAGAAANRFSNAGEVRCSFVAALGKETDGPLTRTYAVDRPFPDTILGNASDMYAAASTHHPPQYIACVPLNGNTDGKARDALSRAVEVEGVVAPGEPRLRKSGRPYHAAAVLHGPRAAVPGHTGNVSHTFYILFIYVLYTRKYTIRIQNVYNKNTKSIQKV
jgi:hypothetical protein